MSADNTVCHNSDIRQLPAGAKIIKRFRKYAYEQVSKLVEHDYEVIRYKTADGKIHEGYFPFSGQLEIIDVVPGTHASASFLAYLAFNKYVLDTPLYREMYRLSCESMRLSRMSLTNWLEKGSTHFSGLIAYLKNTCMAHARAKFKYALDQGNDKDAAFILELIGELYRLEPIPERFIRPLAGERKNSLFFGSDKMSRVSAVYHTIISTCKMQGVSVLDYFKRFFSEIVKGRRDYEHWLPLTIGLDQ